MAGQATLISITKHANGAISVLWDQGEGINFGDPSSSDPQDGLAQLNAHVFTNGDSRERAQQYLLAWWLKRSPDASNVNLVEGKTMTFDLSAASPIRVQ